MRLHGYIDRVDAGPDGRLRIIDYKAGSAAISPRHLEEGHRLQLPIYALAARDALGLGEIAGGFYWHIGKAAASSLKLEKYPGGVQAAFDTAVQHVASHVKDIRAGRFSPVRPKMAARITARRLSFAGSIARVSDHDIDPLSIQPQRSTGAGRPRRQPGHLRHRRGRLWQDPHPGGPLPAFTGKWLSDPLPDCHHLHR